MKRTVLALMLSVAFFAAAAPLMAADSGWLVGKWEMVRDSARSPKDFLEFTADGKAFSISPKGLRVPGRYVVTDSEVRITFSRGNRTIPITLSHTPDKAKLIARSKKTGHTAEYEKVK